MRIAILHYSKPPVVGGVERVIAEQALALESLGHEVALLDRSGWEAERQRFCENPPNVVIVHNVFTMPFDLEWTRELTALAEKSGDVFWVNWVHDVAAVNPAYAHIKWREPVPDVAHVAVSEVRAGEWAKAAGLARSAVEVIPNGIDPVKVLELTERVAALATEGEFWESDLLLLHPARLVRRKNVELGIALMAELRRLGVKGRLVVTGAPDPHQGMGGEYAHELKALVKELSLEKEVVFAGESGTLTPSDMRAIYSLCDALFFPSRSEGFGLPLVEAELHRLPIWCSDLAVHREVIKQHAFFFDPDSSADCLARNMIKWMETDRARLARRRIWKEFSWTLLCKDRLVPLLQAGIKKA